MTGRRRTPGPETAPVPAAGDPVVALSARMLFLLGNRVLLASRRGASWFYLPGGNVAPGESVETALHRQLREGTGLVAYSLDFVGCLEHAYLDQGATRYEMNVVFAARLPVGTDLASRDPLVDISSVAIRDLPTFTFRPPALRELMLTWLAGHRPLWTGLTAATD